MKNCALTSLFLWVASLGPAAANDSNKAIQRAISDLTEVKIANKGLQLDETISSLSKLLSEGNTTALNAANTIMPSLKNYTYNSNLESLVILSLPVISIIAIVLLYSVASTARSSKTNSTDSNELRNLKSAAIDFSIGDEEFLLMRRRILNLSQRRD